VEIDSLEHRRAEVGFIVRREQWGHGYASEAVALARDFVFDHLGVVRLWAVCDPANVASAAVLRRSGMTFEGLLRGDLNVRGERRDSMIFAILDSDRSPRPDDYL
jgi:RimJ/RimL family protein N-acetyltransferase